MPFLDFDNILESPLVSVARRNWWMVSIENNTGISVVLNFKYAPIYNFRDSFNSKDSQYIFDKNNVFNKFNSIGDLGDKNKCDFCLKIKLEQKSGISGDTDYISSDNFDYALENLDSIQNRFEYDSSNNIEKELIINKKAIIFPRGLIDPSESDVLAIIEVSPEFIEDNSLSNISEFVSKIGRGISDFEQEVFKPFVMDELGDWNKLLEEGQAPLPGGTFDKDNHLAIYDYNTEEGWATAGYIKNGILGDIELCHIENINGDDMLNIDFMNQPHFTISTKDIDFNTEAYYERLFNKESAKVDGITRETLSKVAPPQLIEMMNDLGYELDERNTDELTFYNSDELMPIHMHKFGSEKDGQPTWENWDKVREFLLDKSYNEMTAPDIIRSTLDEVKNSTFTILRVDDKDASPYVKTELAIAENSLNYMCENSENDKTKVYGRVDYLDGMMPRHFYITVDLDKKDLENVRAEGGQYRPLEQAVCDASNENKLSPVYTYHLFEQQHFISDYQVETRNLLEKYYNTIKGTGISIEDDYRDYLEYRFENAEHAKYMTNRQGTEFFKDNQIDSLEEYQAFKNQSELKDTDFHKKWVKQNSSISQRIADKEKNIEYNSKGNNHVGNDDPEH